jgi:hypothetical protein
VSAIPLAAHSPVIPWQWPTDVLEFAAQRQVGAYLDPLLEATRRLFPTARVVQVQVHQDPEMRDERWLLFEVHVPHTDVPDFVKAIHAWDDELFRICPAPLAVNFSIYLSRVSP